MKARLSLLAVGLVFGVVASAPALAGDAAAGEKVFNQCKACHSIEDGANRVGPHLSKSVGRKAASIDGYAYSDAMKASGLTWTPENLDKYLANPKGVVPGTRMAFTGLEDATKRADVIAYLAAH